MKGVYRKNRRSNLEEYLHDLYGRYLSEKELEQALEGYYTNPTIERYKKQYFGIRGKATTIEQEEGGDSDFKEPTREELMEIEKEVDNYI